MVDLSSEEVRDRRGNRKERESPKLLTRPRRPLPLLPFRPEPHQTLARPSPRRHCLARPASGRVTSRPLSRLNRLVVHRRPSAPDPQPRLRTGTVRLSDRSTPPALRRPRRPLPHPLQPLAAARSAHLALASLPRLAIRSSRLRPFSSSTSTHRVLHPPRRLSHRQHRLAIWTWVCSRLDLSTSPCCLHRRP